MRAAGLEFLGLKLEENGVFFFVSLGGDEYLMRSLFLVTTASNMEEASEASMRENGGANLLNGSSFQCFPPEPGVPDR